MSTTQLRSAVNHLAARANGDLDGLWHGVSTPVEARDALMDVLPPLVDKYGAASATVAAEWYDDSRDKHGAKGSFTAIPADLGTAGAESLAGWGVGPLFAAEPDWASAKTLIAGGLQRRIANYSRATVTGSSIADPSARGWQRVGDGNSCDFCSMLLSRGGVYTEASADFEAHDHCGCGAEPAFDNAFILAAPETPTATPEAETEAEPTVVEEAPTGLSGEALRKALDPTTNRSASAIAKELSQTAEGRDVLASIKSFTETRGGVANLRSNIEKTLNGTASDATAAKARAFLDAMNNYPTDEVPTLFRGFAVKVEEDTNAWWDAFENQFEVGKTINLNASSFSSSEKKAAEFQGMIGGTKRAGSNYTQVRYVLEGQPHALPVQQLSKFKNEKEWISGGKFEVTHFEKANPKRPYYVVHIRQSAGLR